METWNVKEIANRAKISNRTLHYYDKIGLLKPSPRLTNGYRVYSEKDLCKLEQIASLKFCGVPLEQICRIMGEYDEEFSLALLRSQLKLLEAEVSHLQEAQIMLAKVIEVLEKTHEVNWRSMIAFIEEYEQRNPRVQSLCKECLKDRSGNTQKIR